MPFCPSCGSETGGAKFCPNCGATQGAAVGGTPVRYQEKKKRDSSLGLVLFSVVV